MVVSPRYAYHTTVPIDLRWDLHDEKSAWAERHRDVLRSVRIEFQGEVVKARFKRLDGFRRAGGGVRKAITEFSRKSRLHLLEMCARLDWRNHKAIFVTLTYHHEIPSPERAKDNLRAFLRRLERLTAAKFCELWRMEFQERGAIHFHLIIFDLPFVHWSKIRQMWQEVTGDPTITNVDIELLDSPSKARRYVSKYIAKSEAAFGNLDTVTNLYAGRHWGIENRDKLPFAELVALVIHDAFEAVYEFKRAARRYWRGTNKQGLTGFTLFVSNLERWRSLWWLIVAQT